jgi:NitT/TauT family transport system ATP-binding protein
VTEKIAVRALGRVFSESHPKTTAFENVSLSVAEGEFVCILGPSGCGKSTFLLCVAGLETPDQGEMLLDGNPIEGPGIERGIVFQEYALFPWRSVIGNVAYGLEVKGLPRSEQIRVARHFIDLVGLQEFENHYPFQLSGGMKQRVAIARALAVDPAVLLMDEPFGALDALTRGALQQETVRIWEATRKTILFVTHSVQEAIALGDRGVLFGTRPGRIRAEFRIDLTRPRDPARTEFVVLQKQIEALLLEQCGTGRH